MSQLERYSLRVSTEYIYTLLALELVLNLGIFGILYFIIYKKIIVGSPEGNLYSQLLWGIFVIVMFFTFAVTFVFANGPRYWVDSKHIEKWLIYRPKKKEGLEFKEVTDIQIRTFPIASAAFNFGTIIIFVTRNGKQRKAMKLIGIKDYYNVYLDIIKRTNVKELSKDDHLKI